MDKNHKYKMEDGSEYIVLSDGTIARTDAHGVEIISVNEEGDEDSYKMDLGCCEDFANSFKNQYLTLNNTTVSATDEKEQEGQRRNKKHGISKDAKEMQKIAAERQQLQYTLEQLATYKTPADVENCQAIQNLSKYSDDAKTLMIRALIYNTNLRQAFYNADSILEETIEKLAENNKKLTSQMDMPMDTDLSKRSCAGDTLMHCAARMGYHRIITKLFKWGCGYSLTATNEHCFTPFDSTINQIVRVYKNGKLGKEEKEELLLHLNLAKETLAYLPDRVTLKEMPKIKELITENSTFLGSFKNFLSQAGVIGAAISWVWNVGKLTYRKVFPKHKAERISEISAAQEPEQPLGQVIRDKMQETKTSVQVAVQTHSEYMQNLGSEQINKIVQSSQNALHIGTWIPYGCPSAESIRMMDKYRTRN